MGSRAEAACQLTALSLNSVMPRKAAQEAIEWPETDRIRPRLGVGSIAAMIHTVHQVGGPEGSRVSLGEPPSFIEHDDPLRVREASQREGSLSTIAYRAL